MCTTIFLNEHGQRIVGKNLDIFLDSGCLFTNHRNMVKTALIRPPEQPAAWVSVYGSITHCQSGKELPYGGINEAGLVVEQMTLPDTRYPDVDARPAVNELQWIQYMLDTCATVADVVETAQHIRISQTMSAVHYMACDRSGDAAVIEYIGGKMKLYTGASLPMPLLTNSSYETALSYNGCAANDAPDIHGDNHDYERNSLQRFQRGAVVLGRPLVPEESIGQGFAALEAVKREDTVWSCVYDLDSLQVHFRTNRYPDIRSFQLQDFDFEDGAQPLALDVCAHATGGIAEFVPYRRELNRELIQSLFRHPMIMSMFPYTLTDDDIELMASYPEMMEPAQP